MNGTGEDFTGPVTLVFTEVARAYGLSLRQLIGPQRFQSVAWPRHVAVYLAHEMTGRSLGAIGRVAGGRDHSTICNSIQRVKDVMDHDAVKRAEVARVRAQVDSDELTKLAGEVIGAAHRERLISSIRRTIQDCRETLRRLGVEETDAPA